ncbi:MAG: alpha/beta fold hydrolase [Pseudoalteromonas prydzensis]|uniref:alpha/beta fold hydrolase n=1 Tax=Pseudoalteromonas prydzensis TaxID=182141 RepID=UPI003F9A26D0
MKTILLPGLDGTGLLFAKLTENFPECLETEVISYESLEGITYAEQGAELAKRFEDTDIYIVAESYSGRVAYEIYKLLGSRVKGIVFLASFISAPCLLSKLAGLLPVSFLSVNFLSNKLLYLFGFSLMGGQTLVYPVFASLQTANKRKLKLRLCNIAGLSKQQQVLACPVIYIRPSRDLLISASAVKYLASMCSSFSQVEIEGGHFIAQSNPVACAKVICNAFNVASALIKLNLKEDYNEQHIP